MSGARQDDEVSANTARANRASQGSLCGTHRKANALPYSECDSQETSTDPFTSRPRNGSARLFRAAWPRQSPPPLPGIRVGREKDQGRMGRQHRGLQNHRRKGRRRNEHPGGPAVPHRVRTRIRPVLPRIQPSAGTWEGLKPRPHRRTLQDRHCEGVRNGPSGTLKTSKESVSQNEQNDKNKVEVRANQQYTRGRGVTAAPR